MASTINASNSGSGGIVQTADASGVLQLQSAGTTAVTIDTSQNVGVGTTTPASATKLDVVQDQNANTWTRIRNNDTGSSAYAGVVVNANGNSWGMRMGSSAANSNSLQFTQDALGSPVVRCTIDTSGNVGIGTSSPAAPLNIYSSSQEQLRLSRNSVNSSGFLTFYANNSSSAQVQYAGILGDINLSTAGSHSGNLLFYTTNSATSAERARIDYNGNLLLGQTAQSSGEKLGLTVSGSNTFAYFRSTGTSGNPVMLRLTTGNLSGGIGTGAFVYCDDGGSAKFFVAGSGVVNSTSTSITAISDSRLKENVRDLETGLNTVLALKPRRFDWKQGEGTDQKDVAGFIAQEVETVLPELVGEWKHDPDSETIYKSLAMGNMIPTMVKAIQELKAINDTQAETINALTARVVALESK